MSFATPLLYMEFPRVRFWLFQLLHIRRQLLTSVDSDSAGKRHTETWPLGLCWDYIKMKLLPLTHSTCTYIHTHTHTHKHVQSYLSSICFVSFPINCFILPNLSTLFSKECTLEHLHRLVNIQPLHLTRMAALFLSSQSEDPLKNHFASIATTPPSSLLFWRLWGSLCDSRHLDT